MNPDPLIIVEKASDFRWSHAGIEVVTAEHYLADGLRLRGRPRKIVNLCRSHSYLSVGYYCSLLAEARGERVTPSVETILELARRKPLASQLAGLNPALAALTDVPRSVRSLSLHVFFGEIEDPQLAALARQCFEMFHCPLLEIEVARTGGGDDWEVSAVHPLKPTDLSPEQDEVLMRGLSLFTRRAWQPSPRPRTYRMALAVLHDPKDPLPPSNAATLRKLCEIGEDMDIAVELIEKKDLSRLTQFDALFIRETTAVPHHSFQFARKAELAGMPVLDDPTSILRCTNKAYLAELLKGHGVATPKTVLLSRHSLSSASARLSYPVVLKVSDGSFSRSVKKAENASEMMAIARDMLKESDVILAQEFMFTPFDWRIGVLAGQPLFAARYHMCSDHWQILRHEANGRVTEGRVQSVALVDVPRAVLQLACEASALIGQGFYGVDIKVHGGAPYVIEVNDNPNLDAGAEDASEGEVVYRQLLGHFLRQYEERHKLHEPLAAAAAHAPAIVGPARPRRRLTLQPENRKFITSPSLTT